MNPKFPTKPSKFPWYAEGLNFECTGCGGCCTGFPGFVWVTEPEIMAMASHLKLSREEFGEKYLREVEGRLSLIESEVNYDCVFLEGKRCGLYEVRPTQCRTFPFWPQNITCPQTWAETALHCEGIGSNRKIVNRETIEKNAYPQYKCSSEHQ